MTKGFTPSVPRYQQPLTLMAREATKGKSGLNVEGYRDYRGVRVYGAWLWDDQLQIGLTTEIDEADALGPYYTTRTVILTVLGITVLLALGSLVFAVVIEERASRALQKSHDELEIRVEERTADLSESEERFSLAVKAAGGGLWDLEPQTGKTWYSERFKELLGYSGDESEDTFPGWKTACTPLTTTPLSPNYKTTWIIVPPSMKSVGCGANPANSAGIAQWVRRCGMTAARPTAWPVPSSISPKEDSHKSKHASCPAQPRTARLRW